MRPQNGEKADNPKNGRASKPINKKGFIKTVFPAGIKIGAQTFATILILGIVLSATNISTQLQSFFIFVVQLGTIFFLTSAKMKTEFTFEAEHVKQGFWMTACFTALLVSNLLMTAIYYLLKIKIL